MSIDKSVMPGLSTLPSLLSSRHHLLVLLLLLGGWIFSKGATTRNGLGHLREATCYVLVSDGTLSCFKGARRQIVFDTDVHRYFAAAAASKSGKVGDGGKHCRDVSTTARANLWELNYLVSPSRSCIPRD